MKVLDLFSGIGGFSLGLERAGMETVAFCEFDKKARLVLKKHWPDVPIYNDVRELNYGKLISDGIERPDVICGGFPCQDLSTAGKQKGIYAERSGFGLSLRGLFAKYSQDMQSWKTLQTCWQESGELGLEDYLETWPKSGIMLNGSAYQQRPLVRRIYGKGSGLWPTIVKSEGPGKLMKKLTDAITIAEGYRPKYYKQSGLENKKTLDGIVNPKWAEWLMGFPEGWTDLNS